MRIRIIALIMLGFVLAGAHCLAAPASADCITADQWLAKAQAIPGLTVIDHSDMTDDLREQLAGQYNDTPPIGEPIMPERAVVLIMKENATGFPLPFVLIGFFNKGCKVGAMKLPVVTEGQ